MQCELHTPPLPQCTQYYAEKRVPGAGAWRRPGQHLLLAAGQRAVLLPPAANQPHHSLNQPHHSLNQPHHSLNQPHHSLNQPHNSLNQPHHSLRFITLSVSQLPDHLDQTGLSGVLPMLETSFRGLLATTSLPLPFLPHPPPMTLSLPPYIVGKQQHRISTFSAKHLAARCH